MNLFKLAMTKLGSLAVAKAIMIVSVTSFSGAVYVDKKASVIKEEIHQSEVSDLKNFIAKKDIENDSSSYAASAFKDSFLVAKKEKIESDLRAEFYKKKAKHFESISKQPVKIEFTDKKYKVIATGHARYVNQERKLRIPIAFIEDSTFSDSLDYWYSTEKGNSEIICKTCK